MCRPWAYLPEPAKEREPVTTIAPAPAYTGRIKSIEYTVRSESDPSVSRTVTCNPITRRAQRCDCPARGRCWHMKLIDSGAHSLKPRVRFGPVDFEPAPLYDAKAVLAAETSRRAAYADAGSRIVAGVSDLYGNDFPLNRPRR